MLQTKLCLQFMNVHNYKYRNTWFVFLVHFVNIIIFYAIIINI